MKDTMGDKHGIPEMIESLFDSHCHLLPFVKACDVERYILPEIPKYYHLMSTNHYDVDLVYKLAQNESIEPYFGIHPWYSHLFTSEVIEDVKELKQVHYSKVLLPAPTPELLDKLPVPMSLDDHLAKLERYCRDTGGRIGELGLDKLFRVPSCGYLGNGDGKLSNSKVTMEHQIFILKKQLDLAQKLQRLVSLHCVKAHGALYDVVQQYDLSVILHSFTGSTDQAKRWLKTYKRVKFSLSNYINGVKREQLNQLLDILPAHTILLETDLSIDDFEQEKQHLVEIARIVTEYKHWDLQTLYKVVQGNKADI